jgi:hypothetical protein
MKARLRFKQIKLKRYVMGIYYFASFWVNSDPQTPNHIQRWHKDSH